MAAKNPHPPDESEPPRPLDLPEDRYRLNLSRRNQSRLSQLFRLGDDPVLAIAYRLLLAVGLVLLVTVLTYVGRDGFTDSQGDEPLTFVDALYYATVSITTTGYGDIVPATQEARLITTLVVTPIRILFIVLLVGTTLQVLAERSRLKFRRSKLAEGPGWPYGHLRLRDQGALGAQVPEEPRPRVRQWWRSTIPKMRWKSPTT